MTTPEQDPDREALARAWDNGCRTGWRRARGLLREDESPLNPYREPMREDGEGREDSAGDPPPEPAPAVVAKSATTDEPATAGWPSSRTCPNCKGTCFEDGNTTQVRCQTCGGRGVVGDPSPQPAAAPKELPVEELRREMLLQRDDLIDGLQVCDTFTDLANHLIQRRADRLERGGEGKGGSPKRPGYGDT